MRWLVVTDIHGNLPALEAVLATDAARSCDRIISLGDHVNFGPQPREVHMTLDRLGAVMLLGNHEERLAHMADFTGYNWRILQWTARQLDGLRLDLPRDLRIGPVLCTHGTPGDPYHLVNEQTVGEVLDGLPGDVRLLLSGHNHESWHVRRQGREAVNPGSLGMWERGRPGMAPFAVLEIAGDDAQVTRHCVPYDVQRTARAFVQRGAAKAAPEMARMVLRVMMTSCDSGEMKRFFDVAGRAAGRLGTAVGDERAWKEADRLYDWPVPMRSDIFWKRMERDLG